MKPILRPALVLFGLLTVVCCVMYPLAVTGIGRAVFSDQVDGSLLLRNGKPVGSLLIGQSFSSPGYFWSRPSATSPMPNNGLSSGGSNLGPTNPALIDAVKQRIDALKAADPTNTQPIPVDLVTASASGLDPHISLAAANYQVERIARTRNMPSAVVRSLITRFGENRPAGLFGEPQVNVLQLNLVLDQQK